MRRVMEKLRRFRSHDQFGIFASISIGMVFLILFAWSFYSLFYLARVEKNELIFQQANKLVEILTRIDKSCGIIGFDGEKNPVNFLNIKSFAGSEVGPINLARPQNWQGPYLTANPTIQDKHFYILKTRKGLYLVPGDGVKLSNRKVLGTDIIITANTDIQELLQQQSGLWYQGKPLIIKLELQNKQLSDKQRAQVAASDQEL